MKRKNARPSYRTVLARCLVALTLATALGACSADDGQPGTGAAADTTLHVVRTEAPANTYEFVLSGTQADTLQGQARFGRVLDQQAGGQLMMMIELGGAFGDGLYITRGDTIMPRPGTFEVANVADAPQQPGQFAVYYLQGLAQRLFSTGGRLQLETVSDTLITGSFEVTFRGRILTQGNVPAERELRARGQFRAAPGNIGYVVGL